MQPTNSRSTLYLNQNLGFEENQIDSRIVGNTLKLTFEGVTDTAQYILTVKSAVSVASNPIERQVLTATGTSLDVDIVLPLSHYNINEDYFISLLEASTSQEVVQAKFIITDRISDGGDTVILQYLSSDYTLSGQPVSTDNKAVDKASRVTDLSGTVTNDEWGGALAVKQYVDANSESKQFSFTVGTSNKADYLYNGTDISVALNEAITALGSQGGTIFVEGGSYNIVNSITATGKSNITIQGQKKKVTEIIGNSLAVPFVDTTDTVNRFNFSIKDIVLDNTAPITGDTGILFNKAKDGFYMNLTLRNFTNPYVFEDDSLYNVFLNCDTENCINDTTFTATGLPSNSNVFYGCKFLADKNLVNSTLLSHVPVTIQEGNHNVFNGCVFENFTKAIVNNGVGNFFTNNRIESNDITVSTPAYVENQADSKNNSYSSNYISGNNWVNRATSIIDNGQNYFEETSNFKDQFFKKVRTIVTAGELGTYERQGSGGTIPMITFLDSYANSGTPITVRYQTARFGGTLHDGFFNATEIYNIKANAPAKFNLGVDVGGQKIINVATPTNATDGVNKDYVDQSFLGALSRNNNLSDVSNTATSRANLGLAFVKVGQEADCDYITDGVDDQVQINQALIDTANTSKTVLLSSPSYTISDFINFQDNTFLIGKIGYTVVNLADNSDVNMIRVNGVKDVYCAFLEFNGNKANQTVTNDTIGAGIRTLGACDNVYFDKIKVKDTIGDGFYFESVNAESIVINECQTQGTNARGVHTACSNVKIIGGVYKETTDHDGVQFDLGAENCLALNVISHSNFSKGFECRGANCRFINCVGYNNGTDGLLIQQADSCVVQGCHFYGNTNIGIIVAYGASTITKGHKITNNKLENNGATTAVSNMLILYADYSTISGNEVIGGARNGIDLQISNNCNISNNFCLNNKRLASFGSGIALHSSTRNVVTGNVCLDNQATKRQAHGIRLDAGSSNNIVANNQLFDNLGTNLEDLGAGNIISNNVTT